MIDDEIRQVFMDWLLVSDSRDTESLRYAARQHILALEAEVARLRSALGSISCSNPCEDSTVKALRERVEQLRAEAREAIAPTTPKEKS